MDTQDTKQQQNQSELEELKGKITELENNWKRALADYQNLVKRTQEDYSQVIKYANQDLVLKLIFVLDSLEMMEKHSDDMGLKLITKELRQILNDEGLQEIEALAQDFDHTSMDALEMIENEPENKNKVLEVSQKGYRLKDKVIRPAKVKVGK